MKRTKVYPSSTIKIQMECIVFVKFIVTFCCLIAISTIMFTVESVLVYLVFRYVCLDALFSLETVSLGVGGSALINVYYTSLENSYFRLSEHYRARCICTSCYHAVVRFLSE